MRWKQMIERSLLCCMNSTDAEILDGLSIKGEDAQNSQDETRETVNEWLGSLSY